MKNHIAFYINGKPYKASSLEAFYPVSKYLREVLNLKGTKEVCCEGDCGACTVLLGRVEKDKFNYYPVNSCILYVYQINNCHIITIEGLKYGDELNPVQKAIAEKHGTQCGFCTPGIVTTMYSMFNKCCKDKNPDKSDIEKALTGNLCRCTGYEPIIKSGLAVNPCTVKKLDALYPSRNFDKLNSEAIEIFYENRKFLQPESLEEALKYKREYPNAKILSGGTDLHVLCNKKNYEPEIIINLADIKELNTVNTSDENIYIGSTFTISNLEKHIEKLYPEFKNLLELYASPQIKNISTLAGNIANGSPSGDSIPFLMIMNATIELINADSSRFVNINDFYKGYKVMDINPDEIIKGIKIPLLKPNEIIKLYKISRRKHLDISTFSAAFKIVVINDLITSVSIAFGGVGPTVQKMTQTENFLVGKKITKELFDSTESIIKEEIKPISDVRASGNYRILLAKNIIKKFYADLMKNSGEIICQ